MAQPIPEVALEILREAAEVTVYPYLDRQITVDELVMNAKRCDYMFVLGDMILTKEVIDANPGLKGIGALTKAGANIDLKAATARRLPVVKQNDNEIFAKGVSLATADLTMAMLLSLAYRLVESDRFTKQGHFKQEQTMALMGIGCPGNTVGLIGMGAVARYMVPRIHPFGMKIVYTKRTRLPLDEEAAMGLDWVPTLDELLGRSDFVCIECDYNESTHKLIGAREFALMKPTAYFINTARGCIVDEPEMIRVLQEGRIAGAALDVYWDEPPLTHDPFVPEALRKLDNVILAPHNGGATWEVRGSRTASIARNMVRLMRGERIAHGLLNPEIYEPAGALESAGARA